MTQLKKDTCQSTCGGHRKASKLTFVCSSYLAPALCSILGAENRQIVSFEALLVLRLKYPELIEMKITQHKDGIFVTLTKKNK